MKVRFNIRNSKVICTLSSVQYSFIEKSFQTSKKDLEVGGCFSDSSDNKTCLKMIALFENIAFTVTSYSVLNVSANVVSEAVGQGVSITTIMMAVKEL